jgi:hypothetical protein
MTYKELLKKLEECLKAYDKQQEFYKDNPTHPKTIFRSPSLDLDIFRSRVSNAINNYVVDNFIIEAEKKELKK